MDGGVQIYFVSDGYVEHAGFVPGAEGGSDGFFPVVQVAIGACCFLRFFARAAEPGFGASDGGFLQEKSKMRSQTEPTRMGDALAVHEDQIGFEGEALEGGEERGAFPEGEQAGNIGEGDGLDDGALIEEAQVGIAQHDYCGFGYAAFDAHVCSGYGVYGTETAYRNHALRQVFLNADGFPWGYVPRMDMIDLHGVHYFLFVVYLITSLGVHVRLRILLKPSRKPGREKYSVFP
jgi:hypothetical protein